MKARIFIGGVSLKMTESKCTHSPDLSPNTTLEQLRSYFGQFGSIKSCTLKKDKRTNQPLGFGFVEYYTVEEAEKVLQMKHEINGRDVSPLGTNFLIFSDFFYFVN